MSSKPLLYLTSGDMYSGLFESQILGFCHFLAQEQNIPVRLVQWVGADEELNTPSSDVERLSIKHLSEGWFNDSAACDLLASQLDIDSMGSLMTDDPRIAAFLLRYRSDDRPFFYHALGCRYLALAAATAPDPRAVAEMKSLEAAAFKTSDWVYAATEALVAHFREHSAYRDHTHSIIPLAPLAARDGATADLPQDFLSEQSITFLYVGPIDMDTAPRALLEAFAEVLRHENYRLLICSEDIEALQDIRFLEHPHCIMRSLDLRASIPYMSQADYGLIIERPSVESMYTGSMTLATFLSAGSRVMVSPNLGLLSQRIVEHRAGFSYAGRKQNERLADLQAISPADRASIQALARDIFERSASFNQVKFRNLERLHHGY